MKFKQSILLICVVANTFALFAQDVFEVKDPLLVDIHTTKDGEKIIADFNKKMVLPTDLSSLVLYGGKNGSKTIPVTKVSFNNDDAMSMMFELSAQVYNDDSLAFSYSGKSIYSEDEGLLEAFKGLPVDNFSPGHNFTISSGFVSEDGTLIKLKFPKPFYLSMGEPEIFRLKVNGKQIPSTYKLKDSVIAVTPLSLIRYEDKVTVSYIPGDLKSVDQGVLESFTDVAIANNIKSPWVPIPPRLEAEDYTVEQGTNIVSTKDSEDKKAVGFIDTGDWMIYAIEHSDDNPLFTTSFRLSSPNGSTVSIFLDDVKIETIEVPATGGWDDFQTFAVAMEIPAGKPEIKVFATIGA